MAGLSIARRRKAWLKGVAYGASGKGKCLLTVPKLKDIFQRGVLHGRTHADTAYVRAIVEQERRQREGRQRDVRPRDGGRGRDFRPRGNDRRGPRVARR